MYNYDIRDWEIDTWESTDKIEPYYEEDIINSNHVASPHELHELHEIQEDKPQPVAKPQVAMNEYKQYLTDIEYKVVCALMEVEGYSDMEEYILENPESVNKVIEGSYTLLTWVHSPEQLAKYYYSFDYPEVIDWNKLGIIISNDLRGTFTSQGWFTWE